MKPDEFELKDFTKTREVFLKGGDLNDEQKDIIFRFANSSNFKDGGLFRKLKYFLIKMENGEVWFNFWSPDLPTVERYLDSRGFKMENFVLLSEVKKKIELKTVM